MLWPFATLLALRGRDQVRGEAIPLGIEVVDVRIRRTDLMPEVLQDTYALMSAKRLAEAALLRAIGEAQCIKVRAEADREYVELVSTARRESEIIRGEGDAERNKVFAEAYSKDPEFFSFYRSMQAYSKSLSGAATTLVLNPAWEFLKLLQTRNKGRIAATVNEACDWLRNVRRAASKPHKYIFVIAAFPIVAQLLIPILDRRIRPDSTSRLAFFS